MAEALLSNLDKAAVLLRALTPIPTEQVLGLLEPTQAEQLRTAIGEVSRRPDLDQLASQVMREFQELRQRLASNNPPPTEVPPSNTIAETATDNSVTPGGQPTKSENNTEVAARISGAEPAVLARILQQETIRVMAVVLKNVKSELSASVLAQLSQETRTTLITMMAAGVEVPDLVRQRILHVIEQQVASAASTAQASEDDTDPVKFMVSVLQAVDREERMRLMGVLETENQPMAAAIDECMYDYTDLLRIEDRSIQKILMQLAQKTLAFSLKTAPEEIQDKVMRNMSERVRAALKEEMEFLGSITLAQANEARKEITAVIRAQDKEGTLVWVS